MRLIGELGGEKIIFFILKVYLLKLSHSVILLRIYGSVNLISIFKFDFVVFFFS